MISFQNISLSYDKTVFSDFNLEIKQGDKVLLFGKSGTGKSVLLKMLLGFVIPESGSVSFDGKEVDCKSIWNIRKKISYVNQDVNMGDGTVSALINHIGSFKLHQNKWTEEEVKDLLGEFQLDQAILNRSLQDLSRGERQRIAIILSILQKNTIFILDEITSALDGDMKERVVNYFLNHDEWTILSTSHDSVWTNKNMRVIDLDEGKDGT